MFFTALLSYAGFQFSVRSAFVNPYAQICQMVSEKIYLSDSQMGDWTEQCWKRSRLVKPFTSPELIARDAGILFAELKVSHLQLYNEKQVRRIWSGQDEETGLESEFVDGQLVVFRVHPNSPAAEAGVHPGDLIITIQDNHPAPSLARSVGGKFVLQRKDKLFELNIDPRPIQLDERPRLSALDAQTAVVKVPSFRAEFFDQKLWQRLSQDLRPYRKIIVDLRGNAGGNFVAGLRFLSPFMCAEQDIGYLLKPKTPAATSAVLKDDLSDTKQLESLDRVDRIDLRTFADYGCLAARVLVLIDGGTSSTAEMVAQALRDYVDAKVMGISSSGELLVGVWYPLQVLGPGWKISIPEAVYQTRRGKRLEGGGVRVDRELYYDLKDLQNGRDTWIEKSLTDLRHETLRRDSKPGVSR